MTAALYLQIIEVTRCVCIILLLLYSTPIYVYCAYLVSAERIKKKKINNK